MDDWNSLLTRRHPPGLELISFHVPDLWRLQAQHGTFLFCPYKRFDDLYWITRIYFPYKGPVASPGKDEMLPEQKSHLEILLDQFSQYSRSAQLESAVHYWLVEVAGWEPVHFSDYVEPVPGPVLSSWELSRINSWLQPPDEGYTNMVTDLKSEIVIDHTKNVVAVREEIASRLATWLSEQNARKQLVKWSVQSKLGIIRIPRRKTSIQVQRIWNGMRPLPYTNDDIVDAIANCIALTIRREYLGTDLKVAFGAADGSGSRAFVSGDALHEALRDDIQSYLVTQYREDFAEDIVQILGAVFDPSKIFDFDRFVRLFARQIIPTQVVLIDRPDYAVYFSPARIHTFGLP